MDFYHRGNPERIVGVSPLRYSFAYAGVYNVRIVNEDEEETDSTFCDVVVEDPLDLVDFNFGPDLRYLSTNDFINATLQVGKGKQ